MKGFRPRPCWNGCGVVIVHDKYPGDASRFAWVHADNRTIVHRCTNGPKPKAKAPAKETQLQYERRHGMYGARSGFTNAELRRGFKRTGALYVPFVHQAGCSVAPWEECACTGEVNG